MGRLEELQAFVRDVDADLQRTFEFKVEEVRDSGAGNGVYTVKGHAAVFKKWSLDLGGFRERVMPGAFTEVLSTDPHVMHTWDHDTAKSLSSTRSKEYPLELREDPQGLRYYSRVAPTSYAADLRILMEGGVIDQSSFAFTVKQDEWKIREVNGQEIVERDVIVVDGLFDVTTCAMGAYPTTDSALAVRNLSLGRRASAGSVSQAAPTVDTPSVWVNGRRMVGEEKEVAPAEEPVGTPQTPNEGVTETNPDESDTAAQELERERQTEADAEARRERIADLKKAAKTGLAETTNYLSWRDP